MAKRKPRVSLRGIAREIKKVQKKLRAERQLAVAGARRHIDLTLRMLDSHHKALVSLCRGGYTVPFWPSFGAAKKKSR